MNKRRGTGYFCLLVYFLAWMGSAQVLPLLLAGIGHAHTIYLAYRGDTLRITLHHPGHVDAHEPPSAASLKSYRYDLLDKLLFIFSDRERGDYSDHRLQVPLDKPPHIASDPGIAGTLAELLLACSFPALLPSLSAFAKRVDLRHLAPPLPPPDGPSIPPHLRITVLLI